MEIHSWQTILLQKSYSSIRYSLIKHWCVGRVILKNSTIDALFSVVLAKEEWKNEGGEICEKYLWSRYSKGTAHLSWVSHTAMLCRFIFAASICSKRDNPYIFEVFKYFLSKRNPYTSKIQNYFLRVKASEKLTARCFGQKNRFSLSFPQQFKSPSLQQANFPVLGTKHVIPPLQGAKLHGPPSVTWHKSSKLRESFTKSVLQFWCQSKSDRMLGQYSWKERVFLS